MSSKVVEISPKSSQDYPKSLEIGLWGCLGALWGPSLRQDGAGATPRAEKLKKYVILEWFRG